MKYIVKFFVNVFFISVICVGTVVSVKYVYTNIFGTKNSTYSDYVSLRDSGKIQSLHALSDTRTIEFVTKDGDRGSVVLPNDSSEEASSMSLNNPSISIVIEKPEAPSAPMSGWWFVAVFAPVILLLAGMFLLYRMRNGGVLEFGKSPAKLIDAKNNNITFNDVAASVEEKREIMEVVDWLKHPKHYKDANAKIPKGVLFSGPPGTGKTLFAKAMASEAGVPFYYVSGSRFSEMFVGVGAARVTDMFKEAQKNAPAIIFIDEIDAIGKRRSGSSHGSGESDNTLNQLLVEMDGFDDNQGLILIGATNRIDVLDSALLRPGRFDRLISLGLPSCVTREEILNIYMKNVNIAEDVDVKSLAKSTSGFSGAELSSLVNEAAIFAARETDTVISKLHFEKAKDKMMIGLENAKVIKEDDVRKTAYHEAGHAVVGYYSPEHDPVYKISVVPRGRSLGVTSFLPEEDSYSHTYIKLMGQVATLLGGRAAEEIWLTKEGVTTGASNDLERATLICRNMITKWGMGNTLANYSYDGNENISQDTIRSIDKEVELCLESNYKTAKNILEEHRDKVEQVVSLLMEKETINRDDFIAIMEG